MSNAAKLRKKAAAYEALKQFDRAIDAYARSIDASEAEGEDVDVAVLNKVGDLTLRQGRVADAVTYYERAVEHYATFGLFNNAIALCNKILRNAPGRANVYFTLGRICAKKGLRGDATRNFLEYATRVQVEGRIDEGMRALAEIAHLMPELEEVRRLVEEHADRAGISLARRTPASSPSQPDDAARAGLRERSADLVFLDVEYDARRTGNVAAIERPRGAQQVAPVTLAEVPKPSQALERPTGNAEPPAATSQPAAPAPPVESLVPAGPATLGGISDPGSTSAPTEPTLESLLPADALDLLEDPHAPLADLVQHAADVSERSMVVMADLDLIDLAADQRAMSSESIAIDGLLDGGDPATPVAPLEWLTPPETFDEPTPVRRAARARFRLSPDEFILEGELPPLIIDDVHVEAGLRRARASTPVERRQDDLGALASSIDSSVGDFDRSFDGATSTPPRSASDLLDGNPPDDPDDRAGRDGRDERDDENSLYDPLAEESDALTIDESQLSSTTIAADESLVELDAVSHERVPERRAVMPTPSEPIAAVAAVANVVAVSRRDTLRAAVAKSPRNWGLRRRMAEALFESGERDAGLAELETALSGFLDAPDLGAAAEIADELVRVAGERVPYHQRRVELAVRLGDPSRLRVAYLDLADALVQVGDEGRSRAVYARVLELNPSDDRARAALGTAAPPEPAKSLETAREPTPLDLASWLADDAGETTTRMRMREPEVSGDEQADFDALLKHFKEGVARSLGDDDYESHYDLGVAFKEMGLLDDAIAEFQKALRSRKHRLPAYEALGQCFVEQERYQVAATVLSRALHEPGLTDEQRVGVLYLLALSSERIERWGDARDYYQRVYATDIHFRDAAVRLAALEQAAR